MLELGFSGLTTYKFMPKVTIYKTEYGYKMQVDGDDQTVDVKRIK